jgi:hypothetical protein
MRPFEAHREASAEHPHRQHHWQPTPPPTHAAVTKKVVIVINVTNKVGKVD